jgi:hypothetical protein
VGDESETKDSKMSEFVSKRDGVEYNIKLLDTVGFGGGGVTPPTSTAHAAEMKAYCGQAFLNGLVVCVPMAERGWCIVGFLQGGEGARKRRREPPRRCSGS